MSRRGYLKELTTQLRRYLAWQRAQGVVGVVPASAKEREVFEAQRAALEAKKLQALRSKVIGDEPPRQEPVAAVAAEPATSQPAEARPSKPSPDRTSPPLSAGSQPWKRHEAIYKLEPSGPAPPPERRDETKAPAAPTTPAEKMAFLRQYMGDCRRCPLHEGRNQIVFGEGNPSAPLMFIGEGPGFHADQQGIVFAGESGQLLTKMIQAMGFDRQEVYITNIVKCRTPDKRSPAPEEVRQCSPFLAKQIEVVAPKVIVTLGKFASNTLLELDESLGALRGRWHTHGSIAVMPTYHPAYLLRSPEKKGESWVDLQMVMKKLNGPDA